MAGGPPNPVVGEVITITATGPGSNIIDWEIGGVGNVNPLTPLDQNPLLVECEAPGFVTVVANGYLCGGCSFEFEFLIGLYGDSDGDGTTDECEQHLGSDPFDPNDTGYPNVDFDGDGLTNAQECDYGTDPYASDTDGDGIPDSWEIAGGTNPLDNDEDGDGIFDGWDDSDGDGTPDLVEIFFGSDPEDPESAPAACSVPGFGIDNVMINGVSVPVPAAGAILLCECSTLDLHRSGGTDDYWIVLGDAAGCVDVDGDPDDDRESPTYTVNCPGQCSEPDDPSDDPPTYQFCVTAESQDSACIDCVTAIVVDEGFFKPEIEAVNQDVPTNTVFEEPETSEGFPVVYGGSEPSTADNLKLSISVPPASPAVSSYTWSVSGPGAAEYTPPAPSDSASTWEVGDVHPTVGYLAFACDVQFENGQAC